MLLQEILDNPFPYTLGHGNFDDWMGYFKDAQGERVIVYFKCWSGYGLYVIEFKRKGDWKMPKDSPADTHQAVRIMSTVIAMTKEFLKNAENSEQPAKYLTYSVDKDETSRASLYDRFIRRLANENGYAEIKPEQAKDPKIKEWWNKYAVSDHHSFVLLEKKEN